MSALMMFIAAAAGLTVFVAAAWWFHHTFLGRPAPRQPAPVRKPAQQAWSGKADSRGIR